MTNGCETYRYCAVSAIDLEISSTQETRGANAGTSSKSWGIKQSLQTAKQQRQADDAHIAKLFSDVGRCPLRMGLTREVWTNLPQMIIEYSWPTGENRTDAYPVLIPLRNEECKSVPPDDDLNPTNAGNVFLTVIKIYRPMGTDDTPKRVDDIEGSVDKYEAVQVCLS